MFRIGNEGAGLDVGDGVFSDNRPGLHGQRVNAAEITKALAYVMNVIGENEIVAHAIGGFRPAPSNADARVRQIKNFIVFDGYISCIADPDAHAAPVFVAAISEDII